MTQLAPQDLADFLAGHPEAIVLDVRESWEHLLAAIPDSILIPLGSLAERARDMLPEKDRSIVVYCHHGVRSLRACLFLASLGYAALYNLSGGIDRLSRVDPSIPTY